jgi:hypothetical protein
VGNSRCLKRVGFKLTQNFLGCESVFSLDQMFYLPLFRQ